MPSASRPQVVLYKKFIKIGNQSLQGKIIKNIEIIENVLGKTKILLDSFYING